jgi:universal stress protein E
MTKQLRHILMAIGELQRPPKNALHKAAALAKASGASIELFHAIDEPDPRVSYPETATKEAVETHRAAIISKNQGRLERFARDKSLRGIRLTCTAAWGHPTYDAIVRRALATHADLVIAATHGHRFGARLLLRNTDWELIRRCPVPLLLVKATRPYQKPVILAAVDPFHAHAKPEDLDIRLVDAASKFAQLLRGTTHIFHAYMPLIAVEPAAMSAAPMMVLPPEVEQAHTQQIERAVNLLAERVAIPRTRRHVKMGAVVGEMCALTRRMHTSLVVMGAVSRSALSRLFIGNTAERVLDKLTCDVLIVKPRGFTAAVGRRSPKRAVAPALRSRRHPESTVTAARVLPPLL